MRSPNGSHVLTIMGRWYDVTPCKYPLTVGEAVGSAPTWMSPLVKHHSSDNA